MSHGMLSKIFEMLSYDGIQYLDQSNNGQFTQKILFQANTIDLVWPKLSNLMFDDSLSENLFETLCHSGTQYMDKSNVSQFSEKKFSFWRNVGPLWPNITRLVSTAQETFRNILA